MMNYLRYVLLVHKIGFYPHRKWSIFVFIWSSMEFHFPYMSNLKVENSTEA